MLGRLAEAVALEDITSPAIRGLILEMRRILAATPDGVGLAAPQVGDGLRLFIVSEEAAAIGKGELAAGSEQEKKQWRSFVFINPVLKKRSREKTPMAEGCLSLPGRFGIVPRSEKVLLSWHDERGHRHTRGFTRFFARVIQHEMDHLDGLLISDRASKLFSADRPERGGRKESS